MRVFILSRVLEKFRRRLFLMILLIALALFPFGWLSQFLPFTRQFDYWLASNMAHAIAHALIFFMVGLAALFAIPAVRSPWHYAALMVAVALGQEVLQLWYKQRLAGFDELRDLGTDMVGCVVAFVVARWIVARES